MSHGKGDRSVMEKGWWGEYPPSDRQNRLPEPEQHGGACPGGRQPVPAGVLLCCAPAPDPSGDRAASGREPSAPCPASEDWHRGFCPSHREYGQKGAALYRKFFSWLLPRTPALARRGMFIGRGSVPPGSVPGFCPVPRPSPAGIFSPGEGQPRPIHRRDFALYPVTRPPGHFYRERDSSARFYCR